MAYDVTNVRSSWRTLTDSVYRVCAVPCCKSNSMNSSCKFFVQVPFEPEIRKLWFERANIDFNGDTVYDVYFCEDHFVIEEEFKGGPTRFECQYVKDESAPGNEPPSAPDELIMKQDIEDCAGNISSSPTEYQAQKSKHNFNNKKHKRRRSKKEKKIGNNMSSTILHGSFFETESIKPLTKPIQPKTNKVPLILKKAVPLRKLDDSEFAGNNDVTNYEHEQINRTIRNIRHDHHYHIRILKVKNNPMRKTCTQTNNDSLSDHDYTNANLDPIHQTVKNEKSIKEHTKINDNFFHGEQIFNGVKINKDSVSKHKTYKCFCCENEFNRNIDLYYHFQEQHVDNDPFECNHCGKTYHSETYLFSHIRKQHLDDETTDSAESISTFKCDFCGVEYLREVHLLYHIKKKHAVNKGKKSVLKCNYCEKIYHINCSRFLLKHIKKCQGVNQQKASGKRMSLKCEFCQKIYQRNRNLSNHIKKCHEVKQQKDSAESRKTFKCVYCDIQCHSKVDVIKHIQENHLDIQTGIDMSEKHMKIDVNEDPIGTDEDLNVHDDTPDALDIKPEIFQCSKCPSSFLNEEEMSKHLQIIHGNLIDLYMEKLKNNKRNTKENKNTSNLFDEKRFDNFDKEHKEYQNVYTGYNFAELKTEIKKEFSDPLEDIDLPDEQQLDLNLLFDLGSDLSENQYNITINNVNLYSPEKINFADKNLDPETLTIRKEHPENDNNPCSSIQNGLRQIENDNSCGNPEIVKCKRCKMTFPNQEELLDHMHELINTKAKLYADAKQVLKTNCVQFKDPEIGYDKPFLNEAELLDNIHRVYDKSQKKNLNLEIVAGQPIDGEEDVFENPADPSICRCCSRRLPIKIKFGKYDKICTKCKRIEERNEKRQKSAKAQLYACAKNVQFKNSTDVNFRISGNKPKPLSDAQLLENMQNFFNKTMKKKSLASNELGKDKVDNRIKFKEEKGDETLVFGDNDLLTPLREEDEKIIVQLHDPKLCKSCMIPLKEPENTDQNKTIYRFCNKCKASEIINENRRKSDEIRRKSNDNKIDKNSLRKKYSCHICRRKFDYKIGLRKHVVRSHL